MLFCGLPGTGKSQFMFHLLAQEMFEFNDVEFQMQSVVIPIGIVALSEMLKKDTSSIRQRLYQIHERTGRHILLLVEDIDLLVGEVSGEEGKNLSAQQLTNFFDGVGKISFITIIGSTNHPYTIPARLVRKGRFDSTIMFQGLSTEDEVIAAMHHYIEKY